MTKKFLTLIAAFLCVTGAWADDSEQSAVETVTHDNITYAISTKSFKNGVFTDNTIDDEIATSFTVKYSADVKINLYPTNISNTTVPNISTWNITNFITTGKFDDADLSTYCNILDAIATKSNKILSFENANNNDDNEICFSYNKLRDRWTWKKFSELKTEYPNTYSSFYFYKYEEDLILIRAVQMTINNLDYAPTKIPATNDLFTNCESITLGSDIVSIAQEAFNSASSLKSITNQSQSFVVENGLLYTAGYQELIYVIPKKTSGESTVSVTGDITLHNNCTSIRVNACKNVAGVNLISSNTAISGATTIGASDATEQNTNGSNSVTLATTTLTTTASNGGITGTANQVITQDNLNDLVDKNKTALFIDLSACTKPTSAITVPTFTTDNNKNILLLLPAGTTISNETHPSNLVIGDVCDDFVLTDGHKFYSPKTFHVNKVTYDRTFTENWGTVCLPFNIPAGQINSMYQFGKLTGFDATNNVFTFTIYTTDALQANTPYIIKKIEEQLFTFNVTSNTVYVHEGTSLSGGSFNGASMVGTYTPVYPTPTNETIYYGFTTAGKFVRANGATFNPFRAYISGPASAYGAPSMNLITEDGEELNLGNETSIEEVEDNSTDIIYNINGERLNNMSTPGIYVKNNKIITIK